MANSFSEAPIELRAAAITAAATLYGIEPVNKTKMDAQEIARLVVELATAILVEADAAGIWESKAKSAPRVKVTKLAPAIHARRK